MNRYEEQVEPVVADVLTKTDFFEVAPGQAKGLHQTAKGYSGNEAFVTLTFIAALATKDDGDTIKINGRPNLEVKLQGTNGDIATVAMAVNAVKRVKAAAPGLVTMRDLPIVTR
jgi:4-hydroxy-tetrahydrodipicolinate reductase